jgi:hypothetical protein
MLVIRTHIFRGLLIVANRPGTSGTVPDLIALSRMKRLPVPEVQVN